MIDSSLFTRQTHDTGFYNLRIVYEAPGTYTNTLPNQNLGKAQGNEDAPAPEPLVVPPKSHHGISLNNKGYYDNLLVAIQYNLKYR